MYEELVEEFSNKKILSENTEIKDQKISWISQDLMKTRQSVREKELYIAGFKRELGNIVTSMVVGKELEESVRVLYRKFVRGEESAGRAILKMNPQVSTAVEGLMSTKGGNLGVGNLGHHNRHLLSGLVDGDDSHSLSSMNDNIRTMDNAGDLGRRTAGNSGHGGGAAGGDRNGTAGGGDRGGIPYFFPLSSCFLSFILFFFSFWLLAYLLSFFLCLS
jgi:hypothetical protein